MLRLLGLRDARLQPQSPTVDQVEEPLPLRDVAARRDVDLRDRAPTGTPDVPWGAMQGHCRRQAG